MPGLAGIVGGDNAALDRMIAALRHFDWYKVERHIEPGFAIAHVHLGILPATGWLHGEETDAFTRVEFDAGTVTITNDRFGMMPLFYTVAGGVLLFATELKAIIAAGQRVVLDERGVADLLAFGFCFGEKTLARGVKCLPGGSRLRFDSRTGQLKLDRTWDIRQQFGRAGANLHDITEKFRRAVEKRCDGNIGVSLSGGYDSRTIHAAIDHRQHRVRTLTLDVRGGADQIIAEQIARLTNGIENHTFIENSDEFFAKWPEYVREMVWLTDGMFFDEACVMMSTLDRYRELGIEVALRGHGGELARMQWAYEFTCNRQILACRTQAELKEQLLCQLNFGLPAKELACQSLDEAFNGIDPALHPIDQVSCVYAQEYLRRQSAASLAELRSRVEVRLPFLDADYVDAVLSLPPEQRLGTGVHRHLLRQLNPALLKITNSNTGAPAGASDLVQRLYRKAGLLAKRYFGYERYRHYVDVAAWLRGPLQKPVSEILGDVDTQHPEATLLRLYVELWRQMNKC